MSTEEDPVALPAKVVAARKERERERCGRGERERGGRRWSEQRTSDCGLIFLTLILNRTFSLLLLLC
jgi:hypothetical protein